MIFSSIFLHAVTFSHVLHLDVLKSQIGVKLKAKTEISLCMAIMQNNPLPSLYTQYYRTVRYTWCEIQANLVLHVLLLLLMKKHNLITIAVQDLKFCMTGFLPRRCIGIQRVNSFTSGTMASYHLRRSVTQ